MKSLSSILTRLGRSLRLRSISEVTRGYRSNSSVLSCGNAFLLGCHLLSLCVSPSPRRVVVLGATFVAFPRCWVCDVRATCASAGRAPRTRHCEARCEKSWRKSCVTCGESIDACGPAIADGGRRGGCSREGTWFARSPRFCQERQSSAPLIRNLLVRARTYVLRSTNTQWATIQDTTSQGPLF